MCLYSQLATISLRPVAYLPGSGAVSPPFPAGQISPRTGMCYLPIAWLFGHCLAQVAKLLCLKIKVEEFINCLGSKSKKHKDECLVLEMEGGKNIVMP